MATMDTIVGFMIKPQVMVSSCLLGEKVRYDGKHKHLALLTQQLEQELSFVSVCPEMGCGMPVPRPPIQLLDTSVGLQLRQISPPHTDYTHRMKHLVNELVRGYQGLTGVISTSKSPSCGLDDTPISKQPEQATRYGSGYFIHLLKREFPYIAFIDDKLIQQDEHRHRFLLKCFTLKDAIEAFEKGKANGLRAFHFKHQYLFKGFSVERTTQLKEALEATARNEENRFQYFSLVSTVLSSPFYAPSFFNCLEELCKQQNPSNQLTMKLLMKSLKQRDHDQWICPIFFSHMHSLVKQFKLTTLIDNPLFSPYPESLITQY